MRSTALASSAAAAVAVVAAVAALAAGNAGASPGAVRTRATLPPGPYLFGQQVTADLDVLVDTRAADPDSVETQPRFFPYALVGAPRREAARDGGVVRVRFHYRLVCDTLACTTGAKKEHVVTFVPALVRYRDAHGHTRTTTAKWPRFRLVSRVAQKQFRPETATEARRGVFVAPVLQLPAAVNAPSPTYRLAPSIVAAVVFGAALVALLGAAWLLLPVVALARTSAGAAPELSPLERSIAVVEATAQRQPGSAEHREALALLARELRRAGAAELVQPARRLAWSEQAPTAAASRRLVADVRAATGER